MKKTNRLIKEKSPYLLQHAYNPVDWYSWSDEAFNKARQGDKPVFLSIGYSTCHWCHVMEKESFEDEEVAKLMNDTVISIKVDREERPDIDGIYMSVCQMMTGSGGWPLTIIMTPDKKPFFAGTYFPKESRYGRTGMKDLILQVKQLWKTKREELLKSSEKISSALMSSSSFTDGNPLNEDVFKTAYKEFEERFDEEFGGFGNAPKFPTPHNLMFLLRYWKRYGNVKALEMVEKTLIEMRKGGIYDHIGFGFCRYSTDREWLVPHFEKMLYDQALLVMAYSEAYQSTKKNFYKETAEEILTYIMRDMTSDEGGFYSAEDADSEGEEGKFYLWTTDEIKEILGNDSEIFIKFFNVEKEGNLPDGEAGLIDSVHNTRSDKNILHIKKGLSEFAVENDIDEKEFKKMLENGRQKLFEVREKRIHPYKDDKILTDWNGLMISAFSKAAQVFGKNIYSDYAVKAADFILLKMFDAGGRLLHRFRESDAAIFANVDDYVFFTAALLDLYETTFEVKYLKQALRLNDDLIEHFWDEERGGFFFTPGYGEKLITRQKEIYDGAIPSGNSVAMLNLLRIARITMNNSFEEKADKINRAFSRQIGKYPAGFTQFLVGLDFAIGPSYEIILTGEKNTKEAGLFLSIIEDRFIPNKIILFISSAEDPINKIIPYLINYEVQEEKITVYVCENYTCNLPVSDAGELKKAIY
ncbi:MAG: thioredoxin [Ignavibacteria bacterium GWC2_36_12]|nr:MAG: thioredoxin [Ignavibacteria bacterium GWC2_36_12]